MSEERIDRIEGKIDSILENLNAISVKVSYQDADINNIKNGQNRMWAIAVPILICIITIAYQALSS